MENHAIPLGDPQGAFNHFYQFLMMEDGSPELKAHEEFYEATKMCNWFNMARRQWGTVKPRLLETLEPGESEDELIQRYAYAWFVGVHLLTSDGHLSKAPNEIKIWRTLVRQTLDTMAECADELLSAEGETSDEIRQQLKQSLFEGFFGDGHPIEVAPGIVSAVLLTSGGAWRDYDVSSDGYFGWNNYSVRITCSDEVYLQEYNTILEDCDKADEWMDANVIDGDDGEVVIEYKDITEAQALSVAMACNVASVYYNGDSLGDYPEFTPPPDGVEHGVSIEYDGDFPQFCMNELPMIAGEHIS